MENNPAISIIVPVYNTALYLDRCLDSLLNQSYRNIEIILVDDGSTDDSGTICDKYALQDKRIVVIHKNNRGVSVARNTGLDVAKGEYILFVDSDDYLNTDCLEKLIYFVNVEQCDVVVFDYYITYPSREIKHITPDYILSEIAQEQSIRLILQSINPFPVTKLYSRKSIGLVRFPEDIHWGEDSMFVYEVMAKASKICYFKEHFYHYVQSENSATRSKAFNRKLITGLKMADYFIILCKNSFPHLLGIAYGKKINMLAHLIFDTRNLPVDDRDKVQVRKICKQLLLDSFVQGRMKIEARMKLILIAIVPEIYIKIHYKTLQK